jgi:biotin synthase
MNIKLDRIALLPEKDILSTEDLKYMLTLRGDEQSRLFKVAAGVKEKYVGNIVYYRGLIEYSNRCSKNCYYCGVREGMKGINRYEMTDEEVLQSALFAFEQRYGSIVLQAGERSDSQYVERITKLLKKIHQSTNNSMRITLSLGEQSEETYRIWKENGADRYLLRIESSTEGLYGKLHPLDGKHLYRARMKALETLKKLDYQVGSGVMIGLPFQTTDHLAADLLFFKSFDIDMNGMGPYIEHKGTPLYKYRDLLPSRQERFDLSLNMVASLRILMNDVNIAATTAMQTLDPDGREKAISVGANVIMPNLTPLKYRKDYLLYQDKPCIDEEAVNCARCLENRIRATGNQIGYEKWGDSAHYKKRQGK